MKSVKHALLGLFGITGVALSMFGLFKVPFAESAAKDHWRQALAAIIFILMLIAGLIGLFIYTFDANFFKAQIVQYVKVHKQRDLVLEGDIKVSFFPKLGLNSGKMSLSERNSTKGFASIENARLYIAWFPLLRKQLEVDRITLDGVHANVIRYKNGSTNFDDLLLHDERLESIRFDIDGVSLSHSSVNLQDESEGVHFVLRDVHLETGRLTDSIPSTLAADFRMESDQPRINTRVKLNSHLFFERKTGHYEFANFEGTMEGVAESINNIALNFGGTLNGFPVTGLLTLDKLAVAGKGSLNTRTIEFNLDLPKLQLNRDKLSGDKLAVNASLSQADESVQFALQMPAFEFANKIFQSADLTANLELRQPDRALQAKLNTPLNINLETRQLLLSSIAAKLSLNHPALSTPLSAKTSGSVAIDFAEQEINCSYVAKIDESEIAGNLIAKNFQHPAYTFDIGINALDLDRYLQTDWRKHFHADATPFNFAGLKELKLRGTLSAGEIKFAGIKASKLSFGVVAEKSLIQIEPINASLYGGTLNGSISLSTQELSRLTFRQKLANIQINQLLHDATGDEKLSGKGNVALELHAAGDSMEAWRKSLAGNITLALARGSLGGINLATVLAEGKGQVGMPDGERNFPAKFSELTHFSELKTTSDIKDGVAHIIDVHMKSPLFITRGSGELVLDSGNMDLRLDTTVANALKRSTSGELVNLKGISLPLQINGNYAAPSFVLDFSSASGGNSAKLIKANQATTASVAVSATAKPVSH